MLEALQHAGFSNADTSTFWEIRRTYPDRAALVADLQQRTGRSILHELSDAELTTLIECIATQFSDDEPIVEQDRWTLWWATRP